MGKTCKINESQKQEIIELYTSGKISNKNELGSLFKTSKKKITQFLVEAGVDFKPKVKEEKLTYNEWMDLFEGKLSENECYVAVCKETGKEFSDYSNISGALSKHILSLHPDVDVPSSFLRRSYVVKNNKFWHADYFIIKKQLKPIKEVKKIPIDEIIKLYTTKEVQSTHRLGEMFNLGHKRISQILRDNGVVMNKRGAQIQTGLSVFIEESRVNLYAAVDEDKKLVAVCKETGVRFDDVNNLSGFLTRHIIENFGEVPIPTNTYQRKKYEAENGKKWFEEYFDIIEEQKMSVKVRKCKLCEWTTVDIENKTGCFEGHLNDHEMTLSEYLHKFPEETIYHSNFKRKNEIERNLNIAGNHITCKICNKKLKYLTSTHLQKHGIDLTDYKLMFPNEIFLSDSYVNNLKDRYETGLKYHEKVFSSKAQMEISEFIKSFGLGVKNNDKKLLGGVEIDILVNDIKLGIEYNGLYYHTEKMGKTRQSHLIKTKLMNALGYKLIHIFEDEWVNNKELIKNKILHLMGENNAPIIGARKCKVVCISNEEKNTFLKKNHIQGKDNSKIHLGARYNDELIAVMTFDNKRGMSLVKTSINDNIYELTRFATNINFKVPGIANKLLKHFMFNYKPEKIISFGDIRWVLDSGNNMYTKLGFKLVKTYPPDYKYFNSKISRNKRLHKFGFGKNSLKIKYPNLDFSKTEKQLTEELGYDRVWDCGLFKFELDCNNLLPI